jgi:1-phosphofructokinase family hexose kinase
MIVTVTLNPGVDRTLTVPAIVYNEVMRAQSVRLDWGGKGFNVARALRALGEDPLAMGFVGGPTGQMLARGLARLGVRTDLVPIAGESRTNIVIVPAGRADLYIGVNEEGPTTTSAEAEAFRERVQARAQEGDIWVLSGRLPPGLPDDYYGQLTDLLHVQGARVVLDSSGQALRLGCAASPYLVKPNVLEAAQIMHGEGGDPHGVAEANCGGEAGVVAPNVSAADAAQFFLRYGIELVAVSLGADGLLLASRTGSVRAKPPRIRPVNPVGAGDALVAGLVWAAARGLDLTEMARWAVAAGTASAMREGVSFGTWDEIERVYQEVSIA